MLFGNMEFSIENERAAIKKIGDFIDEECIGLFETQIAGKDHSTHMGIKTVSSSESVTAKYVSHSLKGDELEVYSKSELVEVKTVFRKYDDTQAIRVYTEVKNISDEDIYLEEVSSFMFNGLGAISETSDLFFTRFLQGHHYECQPLCRSFDDYGMNFTTGCGQRKISFANIGSWSTKEELPQGIIENRKLGSALMFQIESNNSWYYEIGDNGADFYLYLGGPTLAQGGWSKKLKPGETHVTPAATVVAAKTVEDVLCEMTKYRRHIAGKCTVDENLPTIFNEYMHLSWDSPTEENTRKIAPVVAKTGVKYYVIDCGWHNEEDGNIIYPYVGQWKESNKRFPHGVRATTDFIRSLGMKAGLWIEPEIIGIKCEDMLAYYDDDCFLQRNGKRLAVMGRHFLDFRCKKVVDYMNESIRRMVEEYGADYIKMDYNEDLGIGTDKYGLSVGAGLEDSAKAYLRWVDGLRSRFPSVLFETCSSGGMRMDYQTLSHFSIVSTSDQIRYLKYPYIAGNILSAVLPEQAAVWSYPVDAANINDGKADVTADQVAFNMINSFLGRMHLASHLELLTDEQFALVKEGVEYYDTLTAAKKRSLPFFPQGFTNFGKEYVVAGFRSDKEYYVALWNPSDKEKKIAVNIPELKSATTGYPKNSKAKIECIKADIYTGGLFGILNRAYLDLNECEVNNVSISSNFAAGGIVG
ncbi:MAG: alpha-galactosidase, partial [Clostridia bacterium]|nr:alpha-galactosidase [Clostridia bacterium]